MIDKKKLIKETARMYTESLILYGVDITKTWQTATSQHAALQQAYICGQSDAFNRLWIPCSEVMPKEPGTYLVTHIGNEYYGRFVEVLDYDYPREGDDKMCFHQWDDDMRACYMPRDIIAWQPLPKPYEEE